MERQSLLRWLWESDSSRLTALFGCADRLRAAVVGPEVHLRGLVEIGNRCVRSCLYCGLRRESHHLRRYRMEPEEILDAARRARALGCGTVVLQSGEDPSMDAGWLSEVIRRLRGEVGLAVTLSVGERAPADYAAWRRAGAERYLLRFETSDATLFVRLHPARPGLPPSDRLAHLRVLRELGFEVGTGSLVGLPGQSRASLADDLALLRDLDPDMVAVGPFIPHPGTPLGRGRPRGAGREQAPATEEAALVVLALARLSCPDANIPSTTALAVAGDGHEAGLTSGANVVMANVTPAAYRRLYDIYPGKASDSEADSALGPARLLERLGRPLAEGPGGRRGSAKAPQPFRGRPDTRHGTFGGGSIHRREDAREGGFATFTRARG